MIVCMNCRIPMTITVMGVQCAYQERHHVYAGDVIQCTECGVKVVHTNSRPHHVDNPQDMEENLFIDMEG